MYNYIEIGVYKFFGKVSDLHNNHHFWTIRVKIMSMYVLNTIFYFISYINMIYIICNKKTLILQISCKNEALGFAFVIRISECLKTRPWRHMAAWLEAPRFIYRIDNASVFCIR